MAEQLKMKSKRPSFKEFKQEVLQNAVFKVEYESLEAEFELISLKISLHAKKGN